MLGDNVAYFIAINEQFESNTECIFYSSVAFCAFGRSYDRFFLKEYMAMLTEAYHNSTMRIVLNKINGMNIKRSLEKVC